jgi:hypothetical protein
MLRKYTHQKNIKAKALFYIVEFSFIVGGLFAWSII